jgi:Rrf2 family iron-sulfur cluster assembly transcriptional regulator
MRLTTKGRFAVTAMIDLALRQHAGPVNLMSIAQRQGISLSYLEQLFGKLRRCKLVVSVRGPGGGYTLARAPQQTTIADIIRAVNEPLDVTQCGGRANCKADGQPCMTHKLWTQLGERISNFLDSVSLADCVREQEDTAHGGKERVTRPNASTAPASKRANAPAWSSATGTVPSGL